MSFKDKLSTLFPKKNPIQPSAASVDYDSIKLQSITQYYTNSELLQEFIEFCAKEFCLENIFFLETCNKFRNNPTIDSYLFIYDTFLIPQNSTPGVVSISNNPIADVNISSQLSQKIKTEVTQLKKIKFSLQHNNLNQLLISRTSTRSRSNGIAFRHESFGDRNHIQNNHPPVQNIDAAYVEIYKLIERDTWPRFVKAKKENSISIPNQSQKNSIKSHRNYILRQGYILNDAYMKAG